MTTLKMTIFLKIFYSNDTIEHFKEYLQSNTSPKSVTMYFPCYIVMIISWHPLWKQLKAGGLHGYVAHLEFLCMTERIVTLGSGHSASKTPFLFQQKILCYVRSLFPEWTVYKQNADSCHDDISIFWGCPGIPFSPGSACVEMLCYFP